MTIKLHLKCPTGAKVRIECRARSTGIQTYNAEGSTDERGVYRIPVTGEHEHEICESVLVSSPHSGCAVALKGRERARVHLTRNNGIASETRFANSLGFEKDTPLPACGELLKQYEEYQI